MSRRLTSLVALSLIALALPATASAGPLVADAPDCSAGDAAQVFLPWVDLANYVLAPGGAAESAAGWTLSSGAGIVQGNEPWQIHGAGDSKALRLAPGASARTNTMCVGIEHPTLRFFTTGGPLRSAVAVDVLFETAAGDVVSAPVGVALGTGWSPTAVMPVVASLLPLLPGEHTPVQFRFTSIGSSSITIDDVYVDPYGRY